MDNLVSIREKEAVTNSLQIAEVFEKRHDHILRDIENLKKDIPNFGEMFYFSNESDYYGRPRKIAYMNRDGFSILAMGFTGKKALQFKLLYIEEFNRLEATVQQKILPSTPMEALELMFEATRETQKQVDDISYRIIDLEDNKFLSPGDYGYINKLVSKRINEVVIERHLQLTSKQRAQLYKDLNGEIKKVTGVGTRTQLREKHYDLVIDFIRRWEPSTATMTIIKQKEDEIA